MRPLASAPSSRRSGVGLDHTVALIFVTILLVYSVITLLTFSHISSNDNDSKKNQWATTAKTMTAVEILQHTFPIHSAGTTQEIPHPGLALATAQQLPQDLPRTMIVPKFFDESHGAAYGGSIRTYLGSGKRLMTEQEAMSIGSWDKDDHETIYCSVASYRDPECKLTVSDLYERAKYPERIRVAILDQRITGDSICNEPVLPCDKHPEQALCKYQHLIDYYQVDARLAVGPVFARHLAHRFYRGEYFAMQIDSHVRFIQHWDQDIVGQWKSAKNEMAVLTTYLSDITKSIDPITHESKHSFRPIMCQSDYEGDGDMKHLRHGQQPEGPAGITGQPTLHPFWAAGFSFARGHFVIQVPYDQYLPQIFQGEEISMGLRGFTYGYDYYAPERGVAFHMYAVEDNTEYRKSIPLFWENANLYAGVGLRAMKRLNAIIGMAKSPEDNDWQHDEIEKYGLGKIRDPAKFFHVFGIHTKEQTVEAHLCNFVGKPMMREFMPALRANRMGLDYDKINYVFKDPEAKAKQ
jgi:[Skp1-protein]-hydroxyproline N-acetylglucosaminyltransferase